MEKQLQSFPVHVEIPVAWGDMDAFQHVNNVMYFRYIETARVAYFGRLGYMELKDKTGAGPILASTQCRFKIPLAYPDTVTVAVKVSDIKEDHFNMKYLVFSGRFRKTAAEGHDVIVSFDYGESKKVPIPPVIRQRILELEASVEAEKDLASP